MRIVLTLDGAKNYQDHEHATGHKDGVETRCAPGL